MFVDMWRNNSVKRFQSSRMGLLKLTGKSYQGIIRFSKHFISVSSAVCFWSLNMSNCQQSCKSDAIMVISTKRTLLWYGHYRSFLSSRLWTLVILTCFSFVQCMWNTDKIWCTKASVLCLGNTSKSKTRQRETLSTPQNFLRANCFYHQLWNICICVSGFSRVNWIVAIKIKRNSYYHFGS